MKAKRPSMREAIDAMCKDCGFDPLARGNWRLQVSACSVPSCPPFELRPLSRSPTTRALTTQHARCKDGLFSTNNSLREDSR